MGWTFNVWSITIDTDETGPVTDQLAAEIACKPYEITVMEPDGGEGGWLVELGEELLEQAIRDGGFEIHERGYLIRADIDAEW